MNGSAPPRQPPGGAEAPDVTSQDPQGRSDPLDALWRLFSSTKLALGLILAIALLGLIGVLVIQAPAGLQPGSAEYSLWLERVRPRYGLLTDVFGVLGFFGVASSLWMRLLLAVLAANTLVCTLNRLPRVWRAVFQPTVRASDATFGSASQRAELQLSASAGEAGVAVGAVLARLGYRVLVEGGQTTYLYADRHRFGRLGTLAAHLALILILAGAVASSFGFRDSEFVIPEGSTRPVGNGTSLAVKLESFADEYYPEGAPKDYRSDLVLYDQGREVARQTIRVNDPLSYAGVRFHQAFFGPAAVLEVKDEAGQVIFADGVALAYSMGNRPMGYFELPGKKLGVYLIGPASGAGGDASLRPGQVRVELLKDGRTQAGGEVLDLGAPKVVGGLTFRFVRERQFTGLQVVRDPGAPIIWVGSALLIIGMLAVFYFPHRRVWVRLRSRRDGQAEVSVAGVAARDPGFAREFARLVGDLRAAAGAAPLTSSGGVGSGAEGSIGS